MRYQQLTEDTMSIESIYDTLSSECAEFKQLTDNFNPSLIPIREVHTNTIEMDFYTKTQLIKINNRATRTTVVGSNRIVYPIFDKLITYKGHASRINHMMSTSSLGMNSVYPIDMDEAVRVFPVGDFKYSYVFDDFNNHFSLKLFNPMLMELDAEGLIEKDDNLNDLILKWTAIVDDYEDNAYKTDQLRYIERLHEQISKIDEIHSDDYHNAFTTENEIWFNCKSYYVMSNNTLESLHNFIKNK